MDTPMDAQAFYSLVFCTATIAALMVGTAIVARFRRKRK